MAIGGIDKALTGIEDAIAEAQDLIGELEAANAEWRAGDFTESAEDAVDAIDKAVRALSAISNELSLSMEEIAEESYAIGIGEKESNLKFYPQDVSTYEMPGYFYEVKDWLEGLENASEEYSNQVHWFARDFGEQFDYGESATADDIDAWMYSNSGDLENAYRDCVDAMRAGFNIR